MSSQSKLAAVLVVILALSGAGALGADGLSATLALDEPVVREDRLAALEAELAALRARIDRLPAASSRSPYAAPGPRRSCGAYAGFAFVFAKPHFSEGVNHRFETNLGGGRAIKLPFGYDYEVAPRVWFGYVGGQGFGLRWRYWQFDHSDDVVVREESDRQVAFDGFAGLGPLPRDYAHAHTGFDPGADVTSTLTVTNRLELHASDFEATQQINFRRASVTVSGGVRYANIQWDYLAHVPDVYPPPRGKFVSSHRTFRGIGPTVAVELHRPLRFWGLSLLAGARGSVLFGDDDAQILSHYDNFAKYTDDSLGVGEAEIALEWAREFSSGGQLLIRGGYEGQLWHEAGSPNWPEGDLGFEGLSFAFGFAR
ncbi:MAG: Lpg1974 family pore-forming outer membrane protein [Planctomycetota bacterium]|jgi:hypothetical protein